MALTFGAVNTDRVTLAAGLNDLNAFTVLMWHFPTTVTSGRRLWDKGVDVKGLALTPSLQLEQKVGRATTNAFATVSAALATGSWQFAASTFDESDGPRIFTGGLASTASEPAYASRTVGAGTSSADSGSPFCVGNIEGGGSTFGYQGRLAVFAHFRRRMSLQEIIAWQYRPYVDADCDIFMQLGWNGTGTQPNLTSLGNGINGTVTGATVGDHVPLALAPSAAWVPTRVIGGTVTFDCAVAGQATVTADLALTTALIAAVAGTSTVTPTLALTTGLAAPIAGQGTVSVDLVKQVALEALINGTATVTTGLAAQVALAAAVAGQATIVASLDSPAGPVAVIASHDPVPVITVVVL